MSLPAKLFRRLPCLLLGSLCLLSVTFTAEASAPTTLGTPPTQVSTVPGANNLAAGDFDKDGNRDLAVVSNSGSVEVHFGDGAGGYRAGISSFSGGGSGIAAADLDGDGQDELIFAAGAAVNIYDWQANGSVTLTRAIDLTATEIFASRVAVGDLTDAGSRDIVVADDYGDVGVVWIPNDGAAHYGTPKVYAAGGVGFYAKIVAADVDGDGLADVVMARQQNVGVLLNKGDGTLYPEVTYASSSQPSFRFSDVSVADVDNDGNPDLVSTGYVHATSPISDTYSLCVHLSNGNGTFQDGAIFPYTANDGKNIDALRIDAGDLNGDGRPEIVGQVFVPGTMTVDGFSGCIVTRFSGTGVSLAVEGRENYSIFPAVSYRAVLVGDQTGDGQNDVTIGSDAIKGFAVFPNAAPSVPTGRKVQFAQTAINATEGEELDVTVLRGSDSTGQVLAFFTTGGTAVQGQPGDKKADYNITDPANAQPVVFAEGEYSKTIHIAITSTKGAEAAQTIVLNLLEPVGDAEPIDSMDPKITATITITDSQPAGASKPGALSVKIANPVKPIPVTIPREVKTAGRTGSDWTFTVSQKVPADGLNPSVRVQASLEAPENDHWTDYLTLTKGKGTTWSAVNRHPPLGAKVYFRTVTTAEGYPDVFGKPTAPIAVLGGPELALNLSAASGSDGAGETTHVGELITYHFTAANVSQDATATPAVVTAPIPKHTTFVSATDAHATHAEVKDKSGAVIAVSWTYNPLPKGGIYAEDLVVRVDPVNKFSAKELKKNPNALGFFVTETGYSLAAPTQGIKASALLHTDFATKTNDYRTQIIGSLRLTVGTSGNSVNPGGLITYTFHCENDAATPLTGAVVYSEIPAGTQLATVYGFDSGTHEPTNQPLANPGPFTNPAIVYARADAGAALDLSNFTLQNLAELPILKPIAKAKVGRVVNLVGLSADTVKLLIDDGFIVPAGVRWTLGTIPGAGQPGQSNVRDIVLTVRVPYDQSPFGADGKAFTVVNDDYDFMVPGLTADTTISALYGAKPAALGVTLNNVVPTDKPHLFLTKTASGETSLNNPTLHGNGHTTVAHVGDVVTVAEHHGVDYQLAYRNDLDKDGHGADAHGVVLHDVIPEGMVLRGFFKQDVNDTGFGTMTAGQFTFYDKNGAIIPGVDPNTNQNNMALVRSLDIRLGEVANITFVAKGSHGTVRYTCEPSITPTTTVKYTGLGFEGFYSLPGVIHSFGDYVPTLGPSGKLQGYYLSSTDQLKPEPGGPKDCAVRVVSDVSWDFPAPQLSVNDSQPFDIVPFDFVLTQNGDVPAMDPVLNFGIPQGTTFMTSFNFTPPANAVVTLDKNTHQVATGTSHYDLRALDVDTGLPLVPLITGSNVQIALGQVGPHTKHTIRIFLQVNGPTLDPAIKAAGYKYGPVNPVIPGAPNNVAALREGSRTRSISSTAKSADTPAASANSMSAHELSPARLGIVRNAPFSVQKGGQITYTISFVNSGDSDATNVNVGMQVPFRTQFVSATYGVINAPNLAAHTVVPTANGTPYTTTPRTDKGVIHDTGGGVDIITWHFATLPAQSKGSVQLVVKCDPRFGDQPVQDHSAYINSATTGVVHVAADDVITWIYATTLNDSKIRAAQAFFASQGVTITPDLAPVVADVAKKLGPKSAIDALAGLDALHLVNKGVKIIPLGKDQVFVISNDGASIVAAGAGNVISRDGAGLVVSGQSSAISVKDIASSDSSISGTRTASYLLDNAPAILASHTGSLIQAGGGNLISQDGAGLISNHPGGGFLANASQLAGSAIQADGGRVISNDGGSFLPAGAPIVSHDAGGLISQDGAGLISQDGAGLISQDGAGLISQDGAGLSVFSRGGASGIISDNSAGNPSH